MSEFRQLYKTLLDQAQWRSPLVSDLEGTALEQWLLEPDSLSRRFQRHCRELTVSLLEQQPVEKSVLTPAERELLGDVDCLLRKVVLYGDGTPWLFGRTLIPLSTLTGTEKDLEQLGEVPLGLRVFTDRSARRDAIEVAMLETADDTLWARRSRLWLNGKPLLVTDLFLPQAPLYTKETK